MNFSLILFSISFMYEQALLHRNLSTFSFDCTIPPSADGTGLHQGYLTLRYPLVTQTVLLTRHLYGKSFHVPSWTQAFVNSFYMCINSVERKKAGEAGEIKT